MALTIPKRRVLLSIALSILVSTGVHSENSDMTAIDTNPPSSPVDSTASGTDNSVSAAPTDIGGEPALALPDENQYSSISSNSHLADATAPEAPPTPLSITIRGGSSLGAYEAGYLFMLTEAIKRNPDHFTPDVLSGASAGTINAILSVVSLGTPPQDNPLESIYYRIWTQLNFSELIDVDSPLTPPGALSSRHLLWRIADQLRAEWLRGFKKDFSVVVGISTTRLLPEKIITPGGLEIPNQQAKFVFRVSGQGNGRPPAMANFIWGNPGMEQLLLPFGTDAKTDFNVMMQAVFASCGIPIVFPPQPIDYCVAKIRENSTPVCTENEMYTDSFVDGGVVDNSPIHLAYQVHKAIFSQKADSTQADLNENNVPVSKKGTIGDDVILLYLDPEHLRYPEQSSPRQDRSWGGMGEHQTYDRGVDLFATLPKFVQGFVSSSRASEIYSLLNTDPHANIQRTENSFAPISAQLSGQFGFMEREILKYDFYLGMHDAENYLRTAVLE
ncbi:MAG: patatin-like phospholipase family protein [Deltaproteobacteria bacterium]|nr:patatin-like phospholipase family protein [Deltaproteobacteria bacterium]